MHVHILGICGTFMGGIAALAKSAGHHVTGSDRNVYPPMSTQLDALGIPVVEGFDAGQLDPAPDCVVVGNVMTRGMDVIEALLDRGIPYASGPEWLSRHILSGRHVLAVAGTHGKTTTTSLLAWILECAGLAPGFLIGGVPRDFGVSARLGGGDTFVVEADEYDTAFFDKRSKFVHYHPRTLILNNLEFDHADIFPDLAAIERQFHHLVRTVPSTGRIVVNGADANLDRVLSMGCWTPLEHFGLAGGDEDGWRAAPTADGAGFDVRENGETLTTVRWGMAGDHNVENGLAALLAARHVGVDIPSGASALGRFGGISRRLQVRGRPGGITVYDDFAHHPTAVRRTLAAIRGPTTDDGARLIAVLEPRSNTMRAGVHRAELRESLAAADAVWVYRPEGLAWDPAELAAGRDGGAADDVDELARDVAAHARPGDRVVVMSNGGFDGFHDKLVAALEARHGQGGDQGTAEGRQAS